MRAAKRSSVLAPNETTMCKFKPPGETWPGRPGFAAMSKHLKEHGMKLSQGILTEIAVSMTKANQEWLGGEGCAQ